MISSLTIVTGADYAYWRSLYQLLLSIERTKTSASRRVVVFDLGLGEAARGRLETRFPHFLFRAIDFDSQPPHAPPSAGTYAWKPLVVGRAQKEFGGTLLGLDSATILREEPLAIEREIQRTGVYALVGQSSIFDHGHDRTLATVGCHPDYFDRPEFAAGVLGFDSERPAVQALLQRWQAYALDPDCIAPKEPPKRSGVAHRWEQTILSVLLYEYETVTGLSLSRDEVDISSERPVPFLSTRNKVGPDVAVWADPLVRAGYRIVKTIDRAFLRGRRLLRTRIHGLNTWRKERFDISIHNGSAERHPVASPSYHYWADPFLFSHQGRRQLFFEDLSYAENRGRIATIEIADDGKVPAGAQPQVVLDKPYHLSYPFVFEHAGRVYMLPESHRNRTIDLYECVTFPHSFALRRRLFVDIDAADSTLLFEGGKVWLFAFVRDATRSPDRALQIYTSDNLLTGEFLPHPVNQERRFESGPHQSGRCAGPFVRDAGCVYRPMHRNRDYYGQNIEWRRIVTLTAREYEEEVASKPPVALAGVAPHHVSSLSDLVAFDVRTRHP